MKFLSCPIAAAAVVALCLLAPASDGRAEEVTATLTLDGLSFLSFQDLQTLAIPAGSTIAFRFGEPRADGSVPAHVDPGGVSIGPIPLGGGGGTLRYGLASPAQGSLRKTSTGAVLEFQAKVTATLEREQGGGSFQYTMNFTTEAVSASDQAGTTNIAVDGARIDLSARYAQLVAATTNKTEAYPEPGKAVYTVLSGTFDRLPVLP